MVVVVGIVQKRKQQYKRNERLECDIVAFEWEMLYEHRMYSVRR